MSHATGSGSGRVRHLGTAAIITRRTVDYRGLQAATAIARARGARWIVRSTARHALVQCVRSRHTAKTIPTGFGRGGAVATAHGSRRTILYYAPGTAIVILDNQQSRSRSRSPRRYTLFAQRPRPVP